MDPAHNHPIVFYEELLAQLQPRLFGYILSIVANQADAKDILQESNQVILAKIGELKKSDRFTSWSYRIAYFQSLSHLKKSKRRKMLFSEDLVENIAELNDEIGELAEKKMRHLEACLLKLQDRARVVISDYYYSSLSIKQIAEQRNLESNHVAQILYRMRKALFECMTQSEKNENE